MEKMRRFIIRRGVQSLFLFWFAMTMTFLMVKSVKGGPEQIYLSNPRITQEEIAQIRQSFGLNDEWYVQYGRWLGNTVTFNFGTSYKQSLPVTELIGKHIWPTLQLGLTAYAFALLGIPLGIYAARHRGRFGDQLVRVLTTIVSATPGWWLGLMFIIVASNTIKWFPQGIGRDSIGAYLLHLCIPAFLLASGELVRYTRFVRSETLEVLSQDYVRTAHSKGLADSSVTRKHVLRNSLIPVITLLGASLPFVLSGAVILEQIFNWPGIGTLILESALNRDYPVVLTVFMIVTFVAILGSYLADIAYALVDPRIRYS
jgi:peptide/nickel transport system permease protein